MTDPTKIFSKEESCLSLNEMMDYIHDRLSNKERNHVERHMLQCEFCNEAMEGLSLVEENKGKEIIGAIDETNQLEEQILFAASAAPAMEESVADFTSMRSAPAKKNKRKAEAPPVIESIQELNNEKSFDWRRLAAVLVGALFIGGVLIYMMKDEFFSITPKVAIESKPSTSTVPEEAPNKNNNDSVIAIAPKAKGSELNINSKPNSDALLNIEVAESSTHQWKSEEEQKEVADREEENKLNTITPAAGASSQNNYFSEKLKQKEDAIAGLENEEVDKKTEEVKKEAYYDVAVVARKASVAKTKKGDYKNMPAPRVVSDTAVVHSSNSAVITDFEKGVELYTKGEYQKAIGYFEKVEKKDSNFEEARWYLAKSYNGVGEKEKAKAFFKEIVLLNGAFKQKAEEELKKFE